MEAYEGDVVRISSVVKGMELKGKVSFTVRPSGFGPGQATNHRLIGKAADRIGWNKKHLDANSVVSVKADKRTVGVFYIDGGI